MVKTKKLLPLIKRHVDGFGWIMRTSLIQSKLVLNVFLKVGVTLNIASSRVSRLRLKPLARPSPCLPLPRASWQVYSVNIRLVTSQQRGSIRVTAIRREHRVSSAPCSWQGDMSQFEPTEHQHVRYNPLKGDWVLVSPHRWVTCHGEESWPLVTGWRGRGLDSRRRPTKRRGQSLTRVTPCVQESRGQVARQRTAAWSCELW